VKIKLEEYIENLSLKVRNPDKLKCTLLSLASCVKAISSFITEMPFKNLSSFKEEKNVQGETAHWLDVVSNQVFKDEFTTKGFCGVIVSEEEESALISQNLNGRAEYLLSCDPLDGSSNLGVNIPVGSIFGLWERSDINAPLKAEEILRPGREIVAGGYAVYGPNTLLVISLGDGVQEFTLDQNNAQFYLTDSNIKIPFTGKTYSTNEGNWETWNDQTKAFIELCKRKDLKLETPYSARYVGSLVADFHRNLKKGGIYIYAADSKNPRGKLRMLYECLPMSYIIEQAGGRSIDGTKNILDLIPTQIHERCPIIIGSKNLVDLFQVQ